MADGESPLKDDQKEFEALRKNFTSLKDNLQTKQVASELFNEGVLSLEELRNITNNLSQLQIDSDANFKLLNLLFSKTVNQFHVFLKIITQPSCNCRHIGEEIKKDINVDKNTARPDENKDTDLSNNALSEQDLARWGDNLRQTFDFFASRLQRNDFKKVANKLKLKEQDTDDISHDERGSYNQYYKLFLTWSCSKGKSGTLDVFLKALQKSEMQKAIDKYYDAIRSGEVTTTL
ncbi:uncharacterized protein TRIADDRAFT_55061 [Trichoplax adhaerens]|uniref:Death domain-containing protein n=1 Tax=Trichoplax adhaerens TaxID=10228 RepID=B3RQP1_TRIAD|nr:predicted protein [Trichoplax adhaerens]EDV27281.1 predicted protein [Trichoplax adhaerens]|eukprot:XP_002111277.1 predicted protein [Trichoplax adhaerens]